MKPEDQIKALVELDGWEQGKVDSSWWVKMWPDNSSYTQAKEDDLPNYLTSYDAIIPLLKKLWHDQELDVGLFYKGLKEYHPTGLLLIVTTTPAQLCEALLRATGKWIE